MGAVFPDQSQLDDSAKERVAEHRRSLEQAEREENLRELRERAGLSQQELAALLKVKAERIGKLERGEFDRVQFATLQRYVEALGGSLRLEVDSTEGPQASSIRIF
ncbi:helix-turn-helix domain-containing protein [Glutamicibacter endophyticus]|uniref:helix-turn-helix domain-containing protein n=1 Tax=Glutamicibacter endophyticus TaxID=1522174 RepID=UPI003AF05FC2